MHISHIFFDIGGVFIDHVSPLGDVAKMGHGFVFDRTNPTRSLSEIREKYEIRS